MATLDEIGQEKQRISERLARLDAERTKLADQLNELEIAERVLTRFGGTARYGRETAERTPGKNCAQQPAPAAQSARRPASDAERVLERRHFEGRAGAWRWRHRERHPQPPVAGIRDDGQAEPPRYRAATAPPCRPARKPRSALAPAGIGAAGAVRSRRDDRLTPAGPAAGIGPQRRLLSGSARDLWRLGRWDWLLDCAQR